MGSIQRRPGVGVATVASLDVPFLVGDWPVVELPGGGSFAGCPSVGGVNERGKQALTLARKERTRGEGKRRSGAARPVGKRRRTGVR